MEGLSARDDKETRQLQRGKVHGRLVRTGRGAVVASEHAIHSAAGQPAALAGRRARRYRHGLAPWLLLTPWLIGLFAITLLGALVGLVVDLTGRDRHA